MTTDDVPPAIGILVAEHDLCRRRLEATAAALAEGVTGSVQAAQTALGQAWSLLQFLENALETHIAKEELALFPRLKAALPSDDRLIDEMVAEHDLIRMKRDDVRTVLVHLVATHDDLRLDRELLRATLAGTLPPPASLPEIQHAVEVIAAKLRVHFENEEELVFPLVPQHLSKEELDQVAAEMAAIGDAAAPV